MKIVVSSIVTVFTVLNSLAQSVPTTLVYKEKQQPGLYLHLPNKPEVVQETILQKLGETGYKPETSGSLFWKSNKTDGYYVYQGVTLPELNNKKLDLYFKVERLSKKEKDKSILYLLVSQGYDNFVSPEMDLPTFNAAKRFLNSFVSETVAYKLNLAIDEKRETLEALAKKMSHLKEDEEDMKKKQEEIGRNIQDNQSQQETLKKELDDKNNEMMNLQNQLKENRN